jgi:MscS family membrane protein
MNIIQHLYQFLTDSPFSHLVTFLILVILSIVLGELTAYLIHFVIFIVSPKKHQQIYQNLIEPIRNKINFGVTWILIYFSLRWLESREKLIANQFYFLIDIAFTICVVWVVSRLFRQLTKVYGVVFAQKLGAEGTEFLLAIETIFNLIFGLISFTIFAYRYGVPLTGLLAGVSVSGIALSFAAQNTLQQLFGTIIIFLDKPFIQGEYIRLPDNTFGRVESIGLRSTKIRLAAKNTLLIVPNSKMAEWQIENVSRGKKVVILTYLDFERVLDEYEKSLVRQTIDKYLKSFFGVEPNTSNVTFLQHPEGKMSRARVTFVILGSTQSSLELRARVIQISEVQVANELSAYGLNYTTDDPVISVDSPIAL